MEKEITVKDIRQAIENMPDDSKVMFETEQGWYSLKRIDVRSSLPQNEQILIIPDPLIH